MADGTDLRAERLEKARVFSGWGRHPDNLMTARTPANESTENMIWKKIACIKRSNSTKIISACRPFPGRIDAVVSGIPISEYTYTYAAP
jgi:hypothetical protein